MPLSYTLDQLTTLLDAELRGDPVCVIQGIAPLAGAQSGQISFLNDAKYRTDLESTKASAVILKAEDAANCPTNALVCNDPYLAYAKLTKLFNTNLKPAAGIHPRASVAESAKIDPTASIGANCVIGEHVVIGARTQINAGTVIETGVEVGEDCLIHANVTINQAVKIGSRVILHSGAVLGSDGFGNAHSQQRTWVKIYQLGTVIVGNDVEIGANTCIDRGALENTVIDDGVRLDNLIQIGHNVHIGAHTAIAGCTAVAGSTKIGRYCMIGGSVAINGHITIGDGVVIAGASTIMRSISKSGMYSSSIFPELPSLSWVRLAARFMQLEDMAQRLKNLEKGKTNGH
ncbi:MAG TPA: UDP-3-O-(3-hydroxymyristoyl)glucosamine N-acyltransferase [Coxiellaceae bacterium]|nr:UDP-3-O-(3-hydroxymyristoyl)glucosamine N-acyltransferase [Coxiellaceae bacterium]